MTWQKPYHTRLKQDYNQFNRFNHFIISIFHVGKLSKQREMGHETTNALRFYGQSDGIVILGATNRSEAIDPALLRPGRRGTQRPSAEAVVFLNDEVPLLSENIKVG